MTLRVGARDDAAWLLGVAALHVAIFASSEARVSHPSTSSGRWTLFAPAGLATCYIPALHYPELVAVSHRPSPP